MLMVMRDHMFSEIQQSCHQKQGKASPAPGSWKEAMWQMDANFWFNLKLQSRHCLQALRWLKHRCQMQHWLPNRHNAQMVKISVQSAPILRTIAIAVLGARESIYLCRGKANAAGPAQWLHCTGVKGGNFDLLANVDGSKSSHQNGWLMMT